MDLEVIEGLDPAEVQAQIAAYEALQKKHEKRKQSENISASQQKKDQVYNKNDFSTGFDHGFDRFATNSNP